MDVLLVDDEMLELEQLEYIMKPYFPNWSFYKAQDASIALNLAKKMKFSLAFLDIQMPGKSGLDLAKELKTLYEIDIIIVSAFQSFEYAQASLRIGVDDYLTKPVVESELLELLGKYKKWSSQSDSIQQVLTIIHNEYHEKLNLSNVSKRVHLNSTYLSRKFFDEMEIGFADYLNSYRLEMAKKILIDQKGLSMSVIAEKVGYNSQHYFSSMFRKQFKVTPSDYRINPKKADRILK